MAITTATATCPDCGRKVVLRSQARVGDEVMCPHCEADLEVVSLDPLELDWAWLEPADDEDWDDDYDDED
jgi:alpha-aminoadipate carrier protein LysW